MKFNLENIDLNKIDPDALFLLLEIMDKLDIDIFSLPINEEMSGEQAGKIIMKTLIFKLYKVKNEVYQLVELIIGKKPGSVAEVLETISNLMGVEDFKDFFTSAE